MATSTDPRHRSRMWQTELGAALQLPQQYARLDAGGLRERWCFYLAPQPHERLVDSGHQTVYVRLDIHASGEAFSPLNLSGLQSEQQINRPNGNATSPRCVW